ncbi:hypothetical protein CBL_03817 [Carabus blaptoides fortunei]
MHRALVILCVLCTASLLVTVTAQPGRMRILPGLTFYNSDDSMGGGGGGTQSLNDEDRNLLNTVLKIISRPEMQRVLEDLQSTLQNQGYPGGSQALTDAGRRMVHYPKTSDGSPGDVAAEAYSDDNSASPIDTGYGLARKYSYVGDNMNEIKDAIHPYNADDVFANQNYPTPNDNYFDSSSGLQQILPALDRRSLSKLDQKEEFTNTQQLAEKLGQRRMMQYEKPNPGNHFSPFLFPTH